MRLAVCALSAVLLSGCSWLGSGGSHGDSYGYQYNGSYNGMNAGCMQGANGAAYANSSYGFSGANAGCAQGAGYNVAHNGGQRGTHGMRGHHGLRGQHGVNAYGTGAQGGGMYGVGAGMHGAGAGMYGAGMQGGGTYGAAGYGGTAAYGSSVTTLGAAAPYGAAVGGSSAMSVAGGNVRTVQGAPIYVAQPYPAYYNAGGGHAGGAYGGGYQYGGYGYGGGFGGAMPFGLELGAGTSFDIGGDIFPGEVAKPFLGGPGTVSDLAPITYGDAFDNAKGIDLTSTYDINQNTTLLGRVGYSKADGNSMIVGTVDDGAGLTEDLTAEFSDLEQYTVEGGLRHYMGAPSGMRPYVGATAGFIKTEDVSITQSSDTLVDPTLFTQNYVDGGWSPTASGVVGAEWAVGPRAALGVETGIRWSEGLDTNFPSDDRWSVPVKLRGRVAF